MPTLYGCDAKKELNSFCSSFFNCFARLILQSIYNQESTFTIGRTSLLRDLDSPPEADQLSAENQHHILSLTLSCTTMSGTILSKTPENVAARKKAP